MSKLLERIERAHQEGHRRIGFGPATQQQPPPLPLLIGVSPADQEAPAKEASKHLDAILFRTSDAPKKLPRLAPGETSVPWGVWSDNPTEETASLLKEQGMDFLLFSPERCSLGLLQDQGLAKIPLVPLEWDQRLAPALRDMPVDGVATALGQGAHLTVQVLMSVSSLRRVSGKPLLLALTRAPGREELAVLRDCGVDCLLVDIAAVGPHGLAAIRQDIAGLPPRRRPREQGRLGALVPQIPAPGVEQQGEEEEEEEEEDF